MSINSHSEQIHPFRQLLLALLISLTVISCVTINIYFPAAAAEKAAEKIVDEVLQSGNIESEPSVNTENSQSLLKHSIFDIETSNKNTPLIAFVDFFIPVAEARQANISIETAKIRSIRNSMAKRQSKLQPYYQMGAVGFTNDGLIASVSNAGLSIKQKSIVNNLIKSENRDRESLYAEIASANGHPEWRADIQKTFSNTWINKISRGWMYQTSTGQWKKK